MSIDDRITNSEDWVLFRRAKEQRLYGLLDKVQTDSSALWPTPVSPLTISPEFEVGDDWIITPRMNDILMGENTKACYKHPGNVYYHQLLLEKAPEYNAARSSKVKGKLRDYVIQKIREQGGRFLTREGSGTWYEMKEEQFIRRRVNQAFRNLRRKHSVPAVSQEQ